MNITEAKANLRATAAEAQSAALAPIEPRRAMLLALLAGLLAGTDPNSRKSFARLLLRLLLE
ncbi:MAG: hypothetical protein DRQ54_09765 [Gammaproteobacteria bacterium]|nr:MAG: hypothetical protein DRQ54_09765 [Gammaproteobacteria bacterium]RLA15365.1 MAG: hypothetical protein DRQ52_01925 [Gammaproteobacteria bacterium]